MTTLLNQIIQEEAAESSPFGIKYKVDFLKKDLTPNKANPGGYWKDEKSLLELNTAI